MHEWIWKKSRYTLFISKWEIAIVLEAGFKILTGNEDKSKYIKMSENVFFCPSLLPYPDSQSMTAKELTYFCNGLKLVSSQMPNAAQNNSYLIALRSIQFSDCNVQDDAFTACAIQWASEAFEFSMPVIPVRFDGFKTPCGQYVFDFSHISL